MDYVSRSPPKPVIGALTQTIENEMSVTLIYFRDKFLVHGRYLRQLLKALPPRRGVTPVGDDGRGGQVEYFVELSKLQICSYMLP